MGKYNWSLNQTKDILIFCWFTQASSRDNPKENDYEVSIAKEENKPETPQRRSNVVNNRHETVQDARRSMFDPRRNVLNTDGSASSDFQKSFRSEEIDIRDFHDFERFPDNEVLVDEKGHEYDSTL